MNLAVALTRKLKILRRQQQSVVNGRSAGNIFAVALAKKRENKNKNKGVYLRTYRYVSKNMDRFDINNIYQYKRSLHCRIEWYPTILAGLTTDVLLL